jgi:hypothetical protein
MDRAPAFYQLGRKPEVEGSKPSGPVIIKELLKGFY